MFLRISRQASFGEDIPVWWQRLPRRINNIMLLVSEKRRTHGEAEIEEETDKNNESYTLPWWGWREVEMGIFFGFFSVAYRIFRLRLGYLSGPFIHKQLAIVLLVVHDDYLNRPTWTILMDLVLFAACTRIRNTTIEHAAALLPINRTCETLQMILGSSSVESWLWLPFERREIAEKKPCNWSLGRTPLNNAVYTSIVIESCSSSIYGQSELNYWIQKLAGPSGS